MVTRTETRSSVVKTGQYCFAVVMGYGGDGSGLIYDIDRDDLDCHDDGDREILFGEVERRMATQTFFNQ